MLAHNINITVFCKPEEDAGTITEKLLFLVPLDFKKEKIELKKRTAIGFNEKKIIILEVYLEKESHTNFFLSNLTKNLTDEQKLLIKKTKEDWSGQLKFVKLRENLFHNKKKAGNRFLMFYKLD